MSTASINSKIVALITTSTYRRSTGDQTSKDHRNPNRLPTSQAQLSRFKTLGSGKLESWSDRSFISAAAGVLDPSQGL